MEKLNPAGIGAASLQVELDSFSVYEELKTLYGYNKGVDVFLVNTNATKQGENHLITAKSAVKLKFFQQNFTIDVDAPNDYSTLFDPTGLDLNQVTGGVMPVYVSSVTYGRMGIMVIESEASADKVYDAVYKQVGILRNLIGINKELTAEEKNIINNASIKVKYTGIGKDADETIKVNGLSGFIDILSANTTYSKESPGIPVAFQLAYLDSNNGIVEAPFQINYEPYDKPYARIEYRNRKTENDWIQLNSNTTWGKSSTTRADIYISFYSDPITDFKNEYKAPAFVKFNYSYKNEKTSFDPSGSYNFSYNGSALNKLNKSFILIQPNDVTESFWIPDGSGGSSEEGYFKQQKEYTLLSDDLYFILPSFRE